MRFWLGNTPCRLSSGPPPQLTLTTILPSTVSTDIATCGHGARDMLAAMVKPPRFGDEWPVSSRPAKVIIGVVVFALGLLAGAGVAMWMAPPA
jgi:hypothetical protein